MVVRVVHGFACVEDINVSMAKREIGVSTVGIFILYGPLGLEVMSRKVDVRLL